MISRVWHGWTTPENANAYEHLLLTTVLPGIAARNIRGYLAVRVDRRDMEREVEFVTTMLFDGPAAVAEFAGPNPDVSVVPAAARALLSRFDAHAAHYTVLAGGAATGAGSRSQEADAFPAIQPTTV